MDIFLEDSDGRRQNNPSEGQIVATLERIGSSLDHCILNLPDDSFVQTAGGGSGLLVQYRDASGMYESDRSDFDVATVARVFAEAATGGDGWKREHSFQKIDDAVSGAVPGGSLKDQLLGHMKREISRETSRGVGNLIRKGIRGLSGRR
jgi:hypothetical protein